MPSAALSLSSPFPFEAAAGCRPVRVLHGGRGYRAADLLGPGSLLPASLPCLLPSAMLQTMEDLNLPEIKRKKLDKKEEDKREFKDLFDSDSDSEDGGGGGGLALKKGKSKPKNKGDSSDDDDSDVSSEDGEGEYEVEDDGSSDLEGESQDEDEEEEEEGGEAGARKNKNQKKNNKGVQRLSQADLKELAKGEKDIVQDLEFSDDE